jgi:hypothetical protein
MSQRQSHYKSVFRLIILTLYVKKWARVNLPKLIFLFATIYSIKLWVLPVLVSNQRPMDISSFVLRPFSLVAKGLNVFTVPTTDVYFNIRICSEVVLNEFRTKRVLLFLSFIYSNISFIVTQSWVLTYGELTCHTR